LKKFTKNNTRAKTLVPRKRKQACLTMSSSVSTSYKNKKTKIASPKKKSNLGSEDVNKIIKQEENNRSDSSVAENKQEKEKC